MNRRAVRCVGACAAAVALLLLALTHLTGCWSADHPGPAARPRAVAATQLALTASRQAGTNAEQAQSDDNCCHHHTARLVAAGRSALDPTPPDPADAVGPVPPMPRRSAASRPNAEEPIRAKPLHVLHCVSRC